MPRLGTRRILLLALLGLLAWAVHANRNAIDAILTRWTTGGGSEGERWQADLRYLIRAMERQHPHLYHSISEADLARATGALAERMPELTDVERIIGIMRLVAMVGAERDGHLGVGFYEPRWGFRIFPLRVHWFDDGLFVVDGGDRYSELVGMRVTKIGSHSTKKALVGIGKLIPRDNDHGARVIAEVFVLVPEFLTTLGVADAGQWTLEATGGERRTVSLEAIPYRDYSKTVRWFVPGPKDKPPPLWRSAPERWFWMRFVEETGTLYVQFNVTRAKAPDGTTLARFAEQVLARAREKDMKRIVVDLRHNSGGDHTTYGRLLDVLDWHGIQEGQLFVIIGPRTFSAAGNFVAEVEQKIPHAILVGSPTGSSPNQYGDADPITLPHSGLVVNVPTRFWQFAGKDHPRLTHSPKIAAPLTSEAFFAGRDPAMEAILRWK